MKIASSFFSFLIVCLLSFVSFAEPIQVTDHSFTDGYSITRLNTNTKLTGICLDYFIQTPFNTNLDYTFYTSSELTSFDNFEKYQKAASIATLWYDSSHSREGIQKAIWSLFDSNYSLDSRYTYLLNMNLNIPSNFIIALPTSAKGSQGYLFVSNSEVPEPMTLLLLGSGLAGIATRLRKKHA